MKNKFLWMILLIISIVGCFEKSSASGNRNAVAANSKGADTSLAANTYAQMSEAEKTRFIKDEADKILDKFGRIDGDKINDQGLKIIKGYVDFYAARLSLPKSDECRSDDDLTTVLTRGKQYAKTISDEFTNAGLPPHLGIYTAMIESEYCPDFKSPVGPTGMFQLGFVTGKQYGLNTKRSVTDNLPDDRIDPQLAARAAAKFMKFILTKGIPVKTDAIGYPLVISAYNSGEGMTKKHISEVAAMNNPPKTISFWTFLETQDQLPENGYKQFKAEGYKYVPKFFAAAIVGENPRVFGVEISPLSESK